MKPRTFKAIANLRTSLWTVPSGAVVLGLALGILLPLGDAHLLAQGALAGRWSVVLDSSPDSARQVLATSAGSLATVLGVVFSITIVTLQLAASQYSPRLLSRFSKDPLTRWTLGMLLGTITFLLLVIRTVHTTPDDERDFVPRVSLSFGILATLAALLLLAIYIHHLARELQPASIVKSLANATRLALHERRAHAGSLRPSEERPPTSAPHVLTTATPGHLEYVALDQFCAALPEGAAFARIEVPTGEFVLPGQPLASVWLGREPENDEWQRQLAAAFAFGRERTLEQDVLFGVRQLVDVGLRALSPALNDPATAAMVANELATILHTAIREEVGIRGSHRAVTRRGVTVLVPTLSLEQLLEASVVELAHAAEAHPQVLVRLVRVLAELAELAPSREVRLALFHAGAPIFERARHVRAALPVQRDLEAAFARLRLAVLEHEAEPAEALPLA